MKKKTLLKLVAAKAALKILFVVFMLCMSSQANAQRFESIAVVVNDDVITYGDIYDRMSVVIRSSNLPDTKDFRESMKPQIVETLITEQLQFQEAEKFNIKVVEEEIDAGFAQIAQQNKLEVDQFKNILKRQGLPLHSMARQIGSQIAWGKVVQQQLRSQVVINDADVNAEIARMRAMAGKTEYSVAEIVLPVQNEAEDKKVLKFANSLVTQMQKGASFSSLARQFSAAASAAKGGMVGWVSEDNLEPEIIKAVSDLAKNNITAPVRTQKGYHIMLLLNKRVSEFADPDDAVLQIKELTLPLGEEDAQNESAALEFVKNAGGCFSIDSKSKEWDGATLETFSVRLGELSEEQKPQYLSANIGDALAPKITDEKIVAQMVCSKDMPKGKTPDPEVIRQNIGAKRMEVLAKSYLQDLRMQSYIDKKIK
jgi:peptidyl-prolyl cis-trans isomerase SurA